MNWAPPSLAICSITGLGKTAEPNIAGTPAALTWSINLATSLADGSVKSEGWTAPMISRPYLGPKERERVVVGEELSVPRGDGLHGFHDSSFQVLNALLELTIISGVVIGVGCVKRRQLVLD